ncbi:MAG: hypothetical protein PHO94_08970 [Petrimonas sp.]|nr:hypothetical protein [Petrimonas sp.]
MKKILLPVFIIFLTNTIIAQEKINENSIIITPLSVFNILNPAIQVGYQRDLPNKLIFQIEGGIILKHSVFGFMDLHLYNGAVNYSYSGYKFRTEIKKILSQEGIYDVQRNYIAAEFLYLKNRANVNNTYVNSDGQNYEDFFVQKKQKYRLAAKLGKQFIWTSGFMIDGSFGIGLAYNNVQHFDRENENDKDVSPLYGYILKKGNFLRLNFPIDIKFGYRF